LIEKQNKKKEFQLLLQIQSKPTQPKPRRAIALSMSLREFHGLLFHADLGLDSHGDLDRPLPYRHQSQLETEILA
jgi:hypothetical protein